MCFIRDKIDDHGGPEQMLGMMRLLGAPKRAICTARRLMVVYNRPFRPVPVTKADEKFCKNWTAHKGIYPQNIARNTVWWLCSHMKPQEIPKKNHWNTYKIMYFPFLLIEIRHSQTPRSARFQIEADARDARDARLKREAAMMWDVEIWGLMTVILMFFNGDLIPTDPWPLSEKIQKNIEIIVNCPHVLRRYLDS